MITQNHEDVPSDLHHMRYIHYTYTPRGMKQFERSLKDAMEKILQEGE
jgi:hypothetical protein